MNTRKGIAVILSMMGLGGLPAAQVHAASESEPGAGLLNDRLTVSLGTFLLSTDTRISVNGSSDASGTSVDFDRDLGLNDTDRFRLDAGWRFAERHRLRLMYFDDTKSATTTLDRTVEIGDSTFPVDGTVETRFKSTIAELAYEYVFVRRENWEIAASAGVHAVSFDFQVSGNGSVNGVPGQFRVETAETTAPLPVFGVRAMRYLGSNWYVDAQAQYFGLKVGNYDGHLSDVRAGVTHMFGRHFGVGAGWNRFSTDLDVTTGEFDGSLRWSYSGAQIFLTGSF